MPINPQTANYPPLDLAERSWSLDLASYSEYLSPGPGMRSGLELGLPLASGQPTTGLTPTLSQGVILDKSNVIGVNAKNIAAAPRNVVNRRFYYGLAGFYYADASNAPRKPTDVLMGEITTNDLAIPSIVTIAQPMNYGAGRYAVRGVINMALAAKAADTTLFTWRRPAGFAGARISYAHTRVVAAANNNAAGDDFLVKVDATTLVTAPAASLSTAGSIAIGAPAATWTFVSTNDLVFRYNLTDAAPAMTQGMMNVFVEITCF